MPIYEMTEDGFRALEETSFEAAGKYEKEDLQKLLRAQVEILQDDLMVIAEEFQNWDGSNRRIDLLAIDSDANIVVIEIKRTESGGHMELQALRYAAMVSTLTFQQAVDAYEHFAKTIGNEVNARKQILDFLRWEEPNEELFGQDVKVALVSSDFSREVTTTALWLNDRGIDVRCIRMKPYIDQERLFVDMQQIVPLPEAMEYQVQIAEKAQAERSDKRDRERNVRLGDFWSALIAVENQRRGTDRKPPNVPQSWLYHSAGIDNADFRFAAKQSETSVELQINANDAEYNNQLFDYFHRCKAEIESRFGSSLLWEKKEDKRVSHIRVLQADSGYLLNGEERKRAVAELSGVMGKLEAAMAPVIEQYHEEEA